MSRRPLLLLLIPLILFACTPKHRGIDPSQDRDRRGKVKQRAGVVHAVKQDESWADIARNYYGDADRAKQLMRANPNAGKAPQAGAEIFVPLGDKERDEFAKRARARVPYNQGLARARAGDYPQAIIQFGEALRVDPGFASAQYNLGLVYRRAGKKDLAVQALEQAARLDDDRAEYRYALGLARLDLGLVADAASAFRSALEINSEHLSSIYALAKLYDENGRPGLARDLWRRYLKLDPMSARGAEAGRRMERAR